MPAVNVATTDTFETQRQKINQIGDQIFSISQGGSDLATGNLKLGDGTRTAPSLAFTSDNSLGIYKAEEKTFGYVSDGSKLIDFGQSSINSYKDFVIQRKILVDSGISILNSGANYDAGTYSEIPLIGGTGTGSTATITVVEYEGTIVSGKNYFPGTFNTVLLQGGVGSNAQISFTVEPVDGEILNSGSGYVPGTYTDVPLTNITGIGTGATANIIVDGDTTLEGTLNSGGSGYAPGLVSASLLNNPTQTFNVQVAANAGTPPPDNVYVIGGVQRQSLNLIKGNTYRFNLTDSSLVGHPFGFATAEGLLLSDEYYTIVEKGIQGNGIAAFVDIVISPNAPTETIIYRCSVHENMGANINIITGAAGEYGTGITADLEIIGTSVSSVTITDSGQNYKTGDQLELFTLDASTGSGSGFSYSITNTVYTGEISSVTITSSGSDYENGDILSVNNSSLNNFGSGFQYAISSNPGKIETIIFTDRGVGYQLGDVLTLPGEVTNISTTLNSNVTGLSATLSTSSTTITVSSTSGIIPGMNVEGDFADDGQLAPGTTVVSIIDSTTLTLSQNPTADGSANLTFSTVQSNNEITVSSVSGIQVGYDVVKVSGSGELAENTEITNIDETNNTLTLSASPTLAGNVVLDFIPKYGIPTEDFSFTIDVLGKIDSISIDDGGNGYSVTDELTVNPSDLTEPITFNVTSKNLQTLTFSNTYPDNTFSVGDIVKKVDGELVSVSISNSGNPLSQTTVTQSSTLSISTPVIVVSNTAGIVAGMSVAIDLGSTGQVAFGTTVLSVDSSTQLTLSQNPTVDGSSSLIFTSDESASYTSISFTTSGGGIGGTLDVNRSTDGSVSNVSINDPGYNHSVGDVLSISGTDIGGISPDNDLEVTVDSISEELETEIYVINSSGGNIDSIVVEERSLSNSDVIVKVPVTGGSTLYQLNSASDSFSRFFIDNDYIPNLTLYSQNIYVFDYSDPSNEGHLFTLSKFRGGSKSPSLVENVTTTLSSSSNTITVSDSTGILEGMLVITTSGSGVLQEQTLVSSVNGNTVTLDKNPAVDGPVTLSFSGVPYTEGVERLSSSLKITIRDDTPNLYYYCSLSTEGHEDEGGEDNQESLLTIDLNNPKVFGSGFILLVESLNSTDVISSNISTGLLTAIDFSGGSIAVDEATISNSLSTGTLSATSITTDSLSSDSTLSISSPVNFGGNVNIGNSIQIISSSGNITSTGILKTTNSLNVNDVIVIDNTISSTSGNDLILSPPVSQIVKIDSTTAISIPSGTTGQRPSIQSGEGNGYIRFNTNSNQYEGYSASNQSWSSLGGVRDLDGNTTILAEETVGANDNTLWFINDNINTIKFTPQYQEFVNVKKLRSVNTSAPDYEDWTANTPVFTGDYLKYRNNIYEVTADGTTGSSGNEPTDTTGNTFSNGTATLQYFTTAVAPLTFEEISELRVDPLGFTDLVVNGDLRFSNNVISTDISDLVLRPNSGQKVTVNSNTSLVIPVGDDNSRGNAAIGSIRFNTSILQYEGYDGTNWSSLGGVRDVDGNTYIIPETSPGANENILYFYNNNQNTLRVTTSQIELDTIDTFASVTSDVINFNAATLTFDSLATTLDNTSSTETFLFSTKDNFDFGLSVGLTTDPLVRLTTDGEIFYNSGFGTGVYEGLRLLDGDLKQFELSDVKLVTFKTTLDKGTINQGAAILYNPSIHESAKVQIVAHNTTTGDKEFIEYSVVDNGTDIFYTDFGNIKTGEELISTEFDFNASSEVRVTFIANTNLTNGDQIDITVVSNIIKR